MLRGLASIAFIFVFALSIVSCDWVSATVKKADAVSEKAIVVYGKKKVFIVDENGDVFLDNNYCGNNTELRTFFENITAQINEAKTKTDKAAVKKSEKSKK